MAVLSPRTIYAPGREPPKAEIIQFLDMIQGTGSNPAVVKQTKAALDLVTPTSETFGGLVLNDPDPTKNGYYYRSSSTWVKGRGFPDTFAQITLGGTANAQTGAVEASVNPADVLVYFATVSTDNTGPMTLSVSGETPRDVVNSAGNALSAGEWTGTVLFFINGDGDYQLLLDAGAAASAAASATAAQQALDDAVAMIVPDNSVGASKIKSSEMDGIAKLLGENLYISDIASLSIPSGIKVIRPVGFEVIDPLASRWKRISTPGVTKPWHKQSADGQWWEIADHIVHPFMFGAVADDDGSTGTDDSDAFLSCFAMMDAYAQSADGVGVLAAADMIIPRGKYFIDAQINGFGAWAWRDSRITGYGATLRPGSGVGGQPLMKIGRAANNHGVTIEGINFDLSKTGHTCNYALELSGASNTSLQRVGVEGGGHVNTGGFYIHQSDQNDIDTGCFWVTVDDCWIRQNGPNTMTYGIYSQGSNNAMLIENTKVSFDGGGTGVLFESNSGSTPYVANSVQLRTNAFEQLAYGIQADIDDVCYGFRSVGNRFESTSIAHRFRQVGTPATNDSPPIIEQNVYTGVTTHVLNSSSVKLDFREVRNPSGGVTIADGQSFAQVDFDSNEYSSGYTVLTNASVGGLYITNQTLTGFRVNRSGTSGGLFVRWHLMPGGL